MTTDPRDIERINPETPNTNTSVNTPVDESTDATGRAGVIQGSVIKGGNEEPSDKQVFPAKGEGENKRAKGINDAA